MGIDAETVKDIIDLAMRMETDGIEFYSEAGRRVKSPLGKLMFESLVADEKNHLRVLDEIVEKIFNQNLDELFPGSPASRVRTVFEKNRPFLNERIEADPGDIEVLEIAMKMEDDSYRLYSDAAEKSTRQERRELFERLAMEEKKHYNLLENTHTYLADTGNWFIYEEHGIMDGG